MRARIISLILLIFLLNSIILPASAQSEEKQPTVVVLTASGPLTSTMAGYIRRGIDQAEARSADFIILRLNTPGGEVSLMTDIVETLRGSPIPVVVYVAPEGAIAGSAGTLITLAGHLAAMAPGTAIGAASPVGMQGEEIESTLDRKVKEILKAQARSLAERRGPQAVALAEDTIENAKAASASEALQANLVDFIARDLEDLLAQLDGRQVNLGGQPRTLHTLNARVIEINPTLIERILQAATNPNILFLLLTIGVQAILIEFSSPGGWVAGFVGAVCLLLAVYGLGVIPVNWVGLLLMAIAFVLFYLETQTPTLGALTAAGAASFIAGALVLFNTVPAPGFARVSVPLVVITGVLVALTFSAVVAIAVKAMRTPLRSGPQTLPGQRGRAVSPLNPRGTVQISGEQWSARLAPGQPALEAGAEVEVVSVEGIRLVVKGVEEG